MIHMGTRRLAAILILAPALLFAQASHAVTYQRLRGTIGQVGANQFTLHTTDGRTVTLALDARTRYAGLKTSSLDEVRPGDFIGTATKGDKSFMVALEIVVFPESMRGTGEGQYPWDSIPDTTQGAAGAATASTMTNGTVDTSRATSGPTTSSTMTNGTVSGGEASPTGRTITVTYKDPDGQTGTQKILLPPTAPVVLVQPADKSIVTQGAKAFIVAIGEGDHVTAGRVLVGENGITPPM